jgi:hypothetical protein
MSDKNQTSGEVSTILIGLLTEVRAECKTLTAGQAQIQRTLDAGERRMDDLDDRLKHLEQNGCQRGKADDDSDWSKPAKHKRPERSQRDVPTEPISKKLDLALWIKYGAMIGAAVAGAYAAVKAGAP